MVIVCAKYQWLVLVLMALVFGQTAAVKKFMFKTCDQNGFCARNRHYAQEIAAAGGNSATPYTIDSSSVKAGSNKVVGTILKSSVTQDTPVELPFEIYATESGGIRIKVDEKSRQEQLVSANDLINIKRHSVDGFNIGNYAKDALKLNKLGSGANEILEVPFKNDITLKIHTAPLKFEVYRQGNLEVTLNEKGFFNYEHWRGPYKSGDEIKSVVLDKFELDKGLVEDTFDNFKDTRLKGPEAIALDVTFKGYNHVYGAPEHADSFSLRETYGEKDGDHSDPYRLYNVDIFEYEVDSTMPMYGSIPYIQAQKPDGSAGVFWANTADTYVDIKKQSEPDNTETRVHFISETGVLDITVFLATNPQQLSKDFAQFVGNAPVPALFSVAYHQCRWNYNSQDDVLEVSEQFDENLIPYDTIWLDIEYTDAKKYFTWNEHLFPDHVDMMHTLDATKRKLVPIIDPHIKADDEYDVYREISKYFAVQNNNGEPFHGHCWPGESVWCDSLNPEFQKTWDKLFSYTGSFGGDAQNLHIWNDMAEPSVFNGPETSMPKDALFYGGWEHRDVHNIYGTTFHNATFLALEKRYKGTQRPFVLTRSFFAGSQLTSATWTGDNMAKWEYLKISLPMILTGQVAQFAFIGSDVGGFFGNPEPELLMRWYQAGAFYPFFRAHAHIDTKRREPYLIKEPYRGPIVDAIKLRYRLLPVVYNAFYENSARGAPVMTPVFYEHPGDEGTYGIEDEFYLGTSGILVKPVLEEAATEVDVYFPGKDFVYYDFWTHEKVICTTPGNSSANEQGCHLNVPVTLESIPMYISAGSIFATRDRYRRSSTLMKYDPYTLVITLDSNGNAQSTFYVDDGESYDYELGEYLYQSFEFAQNTLKASPIHAPAKKAFFADAPIGKIEIVGQTSTKPPSKATIKDHSGTRSVEVFAEKSNTWVVRNPRVPIGGTWSISL